DADVRFDADVFIVRTLVVTVDEAGEIEDGHIVEFASPDELEPGSIMPYARRWLKGRFGKERVVVAVYTPDYQPRQAHAFSGGQYRALELRAEVCEPGAVGKAMAEEVICFVTDVIEWSTCTGDF